MLNMGDSAGNWCLIESDPGVFSELVKGFGVQGIECEEIFDLDSIEDLRDALGFVFLYKWEKSTTIEGDIVKDSRLNEIFFAKQVITNACATQAIINLLMNIDDSKIHLGDTLSSLKSFCASFDSQMKGLTLSNSDQIRQVHNSFSSHNLYEFDEKTSSKDDDVYHFIGYIPINGRLYELDGLQDGPIDHGALAEGTNWIDIAKPVIQARMTRYATTNTNFNLMAVVPERLSKYEKDLTKLRLALELQVMSSDDQSGLVKSLEERIDMERGKQQRYRVENIRRRHNYLPFIVELMKILAEEGRLSELVEKAKVKAEEKKKAKQAAKVSEST